MISWPRNKYEWQDALATALMCTGSFFMMPTNSHGIATSLSLLSFGKALKILIPKIKLQNAQEPDANSQIHQINKKLSDQVGISPPELFLSKHFEENNASVLSGKIVMDRKSFSDESGLTPAEQEAVLAHEIAHIIRRTEQKQFLKYALFCSYVGGFYASLPSCTTMSDLGIRTATLLSTHFFIQYSTKLEEFSADTEAAKIMGDAEPLSLLFNRILEEKREFTQPPSRSNKLANTFNCLVNLPIKAINFLFNDHPSLDKRIKNLESMKLPDLNKP